MTAAWLDGTTADRPASAFEAWSVAAFGAVEDDYFIDGVATSASTTFTSATANFTGADVGKNIVILRGGVSSAQDHHTTIASVTNSTTVVLTHAAGRSQTSCRFYISRAGDQTSVIQAALNACGASGGGMVKFPGVGYLVSGLTLPNRVGIEGGGQRATMVHLLGGATLPVVAADYTLNNAATACAIRNIWLDGNSQRAADTTTTLTANYTAGQTTMTVADNSNFRSSGIFSIGSTMFAYTAKSGTTSLTGVGVIGGTTDASQTSGATLTQKPCGIYLAKNPYNSGGTIEETFDPHHLISDVFVKNTRGTGVEAWGQSDDRMRNVWVAYAFQYGIKPSFDSALADCTTENTGLAGYLFRHADIKATNCKAFFAGGITAAQGWGFRIEGTASLIEEGINLLSSCTAQDNKADGFSLAGADHCILAACGASSNGTSAIGGSYVGVSMSACTRCDISVACTDRVASPNTSQLSALAIDAACVGNRIWIGHGPAGAASNGPAVRSGSDLSGGNDLRVNGQGGSTSVAYAASITPDPYVATTYVVGTLTGNLSVAAPANAHQGAKLRFRLVQDATGGRTVTWDSSFKVSGSAVSTTASKISTVDFEYDGASWVQVGGLAGL